MTIHSVTVVAGSAGNIGPPGPPGPSYDATSIDMQTISVGPKVFTTQTTLAYLAGARCRMASAASPIDNWMEGQVTAYLDDQLSVDVTLLGQSRDGFPHSDWLISLAGEPGQQGAAGLSGTSGTNGNVIWQGVAAPSGTNPASPTDGDWYMQFDPAVPGGPAHMWGPYNHTATNPWGTAGVLLATGPPGPTGAQGPKGDTGTTGAQGPQGNPGPSGSVGPQGNVGPQGVAGAGYTATSTTSVALGAGNVTVTVPSGLAYTVGARVRLTSFSSPTNWMEGQVTAYSGTSLTFNSSLVSGSGTFANWTLNLAGEKGVKGDTGASGAGAGDMLSTNNLSDVADVATSRNNLQLVPVAWTGNYNDLTNRPSVTQRSVTASPITIAALDDVLNCNVTGAIACTLPASATRTGRRVVFKDVGGKFAAGNLTITPAGAEKIDGLSSVVLRTNYQQLVLRPMNDGVNTGWAIDG